MIRLVTLTHFIIKHYVIPYCCQAGSKIHNNAHYGLDLLLRKL